MCLLQKSSEFGLNLVAMVTANPQPFSKNIFLISEFICNHLKNEKMFCSQCLF